MKQIPMISRFCLALILLMTTAIMSADSCCASICDLFECGSFAYQTRIGIYPTLWRNGGELFLNNCDCAANATSVGTSLGELPKFNKFFNIPWIVGTQLQYEWCDCVSIYGELNYIQASHKKTARNTVVPVNTAIALVLSDYRAISGYAGLMYTFSDMCWCENVGLFLGAKIGFIHHCTIDAHHIVAPVTVSGCACIDGFKRNFFKKSTRISGGGLIGLTYDICDRLALVLMGEVVVSGGPKGSACIPLLSSEILQLGSSSLFVSRIKTEISFPITLGLKYSF